MKKLFALFAVFLAIFGLASCTKKPVKDEQGIKVVVKQGDEDFYSDIFKVTLFKKKVSDCLEKAKVSIVETKDNETIYYTVTCGDKDPYLAKEVKYQIVTAEVEPYYITYDKLEDTKVPKNTVVYVLTELK